MPFPRLTPQQIAELDVAAPRYTSYPTVPEWSERFGSDDHARALAETGRAGEPVSLYVHIPFCREMCTYCGCNVVVSRDRHRADAYLTALDRELALVAQHVGARLPLARLHLGGGTPTFLDEEQLQRLWRSIVERFEPLPKAELAIEIDPVVTRPAQLELLGGLGFNRISLGVQDLDPEVQHSVNRIQTLDETARSIALARQVGFRSVNLDLIYGLPRQTPVSWARTIEQIKILRPDRVSLFSFAYVPDVRPNQRKLPRADIPTGAAKLELFRLAHDALEEAGYRAIGMDHFALADDELSRAQARGQLWRDFQGYSAGSPSATIAVGISAISDAGGAYVQNVKSLAAHAAAVAAGRLPTARGHWLDADDRRRRAIIRDIMCNFEIRLTARETLEMPDELADLRTLERQGLIELSPGGGWGTLTPVGRVFVRNVAAVFDTYLRRRAGDARPTFSRTV